MRPIATRFWEKVQVGTVDECWLWTAYKDNGYGIFKTHTNGKPKIYKAHIMSYILHNGPFLNSKCVCHKCDNPSCVNPSHLFLGTHKDNMQDKKNKHRAFRHPRKLNFQDAINIRNEYEKGATQNQLALKYSTSRQNIGKIVLNRTFIKETA